MSSDDGIEYHKSLQQNQQQHQQHHHHQQQLQSSSSIVSSASSAITSSSSLSSSSSSSSTTIPQTCSLALNSGAGSHQQQPQQQSIATSVSANTIDRRRKSSLSYQHQLQQATSSSSEIGVGSTCPIDSSSSGSTGCPSASNYANGASPNRYITTHHHHHHHNQSDGYHHIGSRLSIHPIDRYDDNLASCCLPPPSPAPTSDRYIMGIPSPSSSSTGPSSHHHYSDQSPSQAAPPAIKYGGTGATTIHRTMSPSPRYRMSDRYRDASPKCDRFVTATHFLANSTPLVSSDTYAYLSSTVHTPVKRYVPTPPPTTEIYSDIGQSSSSQSSSSGYHTIGNSPHLPQPQTVIPAVNTLPYRFRMKCCSAVDQSVTPPSLSVQQQHDQRSAVSDQYAIPSRVRPLKCPSTGSVSSQQQLSVAAAASPTVASTSQSVRQLRTACVAGEYMQRTPSAEYLGSSGGRLITPVSVMSEPSSGTCLHCNTIRRTTGVHQTTQTTGPISPVPQQQNLSLSSSTSGVGIIDSCASGEPLMNSTASPTPSTNPSQTTPLSPQQHQQQQQQHQHHSNIADYSGIQQQPQQAQPAILSSHSSLLSRTIAQPITQQQHHPPQPQPHHHSVPVSQPLPHLHHSNIHDSVSNSANSNLFSTTPQRNTLTVRQQMQRFSRKQRLREYVRREIAKFFGVDIQTEDDERPKWCERQKRLAVRRFGPLKPELEPGGIGTARNQRNGTNHQSAVLAGDRPDILPAQTTDETQIHNPHLGYSGDGYDRVAIEKKASVPTMLVAGLSYIVQTLNKRQKRNYKQWSRSFAPAHVTAINGDNPGDICEGLTALQEEEVFFDTPGNDIGNPSGQSGNGGGAGNLATTSNHQNLGVRQIYMGERVHGWRTSSDHQQQLQQQQYHHQQQQPNSGCILPGGGNGINNGAAGLMGVQQRIGYRGNRISSQLLDGVLDNSRRPLARKVKLFRSHELDDRNDHRPFFTYWINTVQIMVLALSLICYGIGPIGIGVEQKSGSVLVTSLSLQTVQHQEQRNVWIGPRGHDLVHLGAKFAACMRRDMKIMEVISKTRRQERETACCIRNDDSGCVQSSQADCTVRGLWPSQSISTWKKWSPGESGPGGRISGSVCGLDPKYCDAPASIAPFEWPDDITKWPICRKTNSFSQRFRFKDHTAEHMVCEVIGHPCCTGVFGECRITTREYCDFVNGYFHEEASLCSQISCLNNVCGLFPFLSTEVPDQFYRLFTSLCLHAGILHLAITVAFQHIFLADLERLIGPIRTAIVYIGSGLAGNLTSSILVPYKPEVGPLASLAGVISSLVVLLLLIHWKQLKKPHLALMKLIVLAGTLFGMGTLPWQQNFAGLIAGIMCGVLLTIALVPFVSITKYGRKSKINLIWTCMLFHLVMYALMFVIFYIFPNEFTSFNFGDVLNSGMGTTTTSGGFDTIGDGGNTIHQHHHHHHQHGEDIAMNGGIRPPSADNINNDDVDGQRGDGATFSSSYGNVQQLQHEQSQQQQQSQHHRILSSNNINNLNNNGNSIVTCDKGSCTTSTTNGGSIVAVTTVNGDHDRNILGSSSDITENLNNNNNLKLNNNNIEDSVDVEGISDGGGQNFHHSNKIKNGAADRNDIEGTLVGSNVLSINHRIITA